MKRILILASMVFFVAGCQHFAKQNRVSRQDLAGSTHIAILSAVPWDLYVEALQPTFKLTADDALAQAIPDTTAIEEKLLNAFAGKLKVALPQSSTTSTITTSSGTGKDTTSSTDVTKQTKPGDVSTVDFGQFSASSQKASDLPGANVLTNRMGIDPLLKYLVANALYQEVQLINQQIKNAAINDSAYDAFLLRLQVTLMPRQRDEPYDAYSDISFFVGNVGTPRQDLVAMSGLPPVSGVGIAPGPETGSSSFQTGDGSNVNTPKIIPLLVTDDIQAALHSRAQDEILQLGLALSGMISGVGFGTDLQSASDKLRTTLGRDFNSTFTIGRESENTLRVRFGAIQQGAGTYAMVPQTHNVTVLLLMPKSKTDLSLVSKTTMIDADKGTVLPGRDQNAFWREARATIREYGQSKCLRKEAIEELLVPIERNDFDGFKNVLKSKGIETEKQGSLWVDLAALKHGTQYGFTYATLPLNPSSSVALPAQAPTLIDDNKTSTTVALQGGVGIRAKQLRATLSLLNTNREIPLLAQTIEVVDGGRSINATFPSLSALKLATDGKLQTSYTATVTLTLKDYKGTETAWTSKPAIYLPKASTEPSFSMSIGSRVIDSISSTGTVSIVFSKIKAKVYFSVDGADLVLPLPAQLKTDDKGLYIDSAATLSLGLQNLNPIANVIFTAKDDSGASVQLTRPVLEIPPAKRGP